MLIHRIQTKETVNLSEYIFTRFSKVSSVLSKLKRKSKQFIILVECTRLSGIKIYRKGLNRRKTFRH